MQATNVAIQVSYFQFLSLFLIFIYNIELHIQIIGTINAL